MAILAFGAGFLKKTGLIEERGVLGGPSPALLESARGAELGQTAVQGMGAGAMIQTGIEGGSIAPPSSGPIATADAMVKDPGAPVGPAFDRSGVVAYAVQRGDTLSRIASYFGISVDTIANANPGVKSKVLQIGQNIKILPTSGVVYQTRTGDTIESISSDFGIPQNKIRQFNRSVNFASLDLGVSVIIPGGTNRNRLAAAGSSLPNFNDQFILPANGYNWGILHHYNAVDIANSCGTPVAAAAEGLVVPDPNIPNISGGWNTGYGDFVLIEHPFGNAVETRYAHLQKVEVQIGDYVKQGDVIGLMGESGEASGCHVHFEVIGAQNPFVKS